MFEDFLDQLKFHVSVKFYDLFWSNEKFINYWLRDFDVNNFYKELNNKPKEVIIRLILINW